MIEPLVPGPFARVHKLIGKLSAGDREVGDLQMVVQFSAVEPGRIRGQVLGDNSTYDRLVPLGDIALGPLRIESTAAEDGNTISSDRARFAGFDVSYHPQDPMSKSVRPIAELDLQNVSISQAGLAGTSSRRAVFALCGPRNAWQIHEKWTTSPARLEVGAGNAGLPIPVEGLEVEVLPSLRHDIATVPGDNARYTKLITLAISESKPRWFSSDVGFEHAARDLADDLTLLMSLATIRATTWFSYDLRVPRSSTTYTRALGHSFTSKVPLHECIVDWHLIRGFVAQSLPKLRELRSQEVDLRTPISVFVRGNEPALDGQRFGITWLALEELQELHCKKGLKASPPPSGEEERQKLHQKKGSTASPVLGDAELSSLRSRVEQYCNAEAWPKAKIKAVQQKLGELGRPSVSAKLNAMLHDLHVEVVDLYPEDCEPTYEKTRGALLHGSEPPDSLMVFWEFQRLRAVVGRALLLALGWQDLSHCPANDLRVFLSVQSP